MVGINRSAHFPLKDLAAMDAIGKRLAPQDAWGEWGPMIEGIPEKHGGLRSITMEQINLDDREKGYIRAKVEPSPLVKPGVFVDINDHYQVSTVEDAVGCAEAVGVVKLRFEDSIRRSAWIMDQVIAPTT